MVSRENAVVLPFMAVGLALAYGGRVATDLSDTALIGVLLFVGVAAPRPVVGDLESEDSD